MAEARRTSSRQRWTLVLVCTAVFMLLLEITVVSVALPSIQRDLRASLSDLQWVSAAYALVLAMVVTEGWPPNVDRARRLLSPHGVEVVPVRPGQPLPFPGGSFELVTSRHPVAPDWPELARLLVNGGTYFAQHVGPDSARELIEYFVGPLPAGHDVRDPERESGAARRAGLQIVDLRTARCRMEFLDIGAVVYILRKCVWWVADFTVELYRDVLQRLDAEIR